MESHFVGASGRKYYFSQLETEIRRDYPELVGAHVLTQIKELGLGPEFDAGYTPSALPFTLAEKESNETKA